MEWLELEDVIMEPAAKGMSRLSVRIIARNASKPALPARPTILQPASPAEPPVSSQTQVHAFPAQLPVSVARLSRSALPATTAALFKATGATPQSATPVLSKSNQPARLAM